MKDTVRRLHRGGDMKHESSSAVNLSTLLDYADAVTEPPLRAPITRAIKRLTRKTGLNTLVLPDRPGAAVVLFFHKVQRRPMGLWGEPVLSVEAFEKQIAFLARHFRPISLTSLVGLVREQRPIPDRSVVLTFDDGYRNNLLLAAPVLKRYGVPATLFVTTGLIGTDAWMWGYEVEEIFLREQPAHIGEASGHAQFRELCRHGLPRRNAAIACVQLLKMIPDEQKEAVLDRLRRAFPVEVDDENRFLSWDEVRRIRDFGVEIGAHTVTHPLLNRLELERAEWEMVESKQRLERELGEPVTTFAYPNGNTTPEIEALAHEHFDASVTTTSGTLTASSPLQALPRVCGPDNDVDLSFELAKYFFNADPWRAFGR